MEVIQGCRRASSADSRSSFHRHEVLLFSTERVERSVRLSTLYGVRSSNSSIGHSNAARQCVGCWRFMATTANPRQHAQSQRPVMKTSKSNNCRRRGHQKAEGRKLRKLRGLRDARKCEAGAMLDILGKADALKVSSDSLKSIIVESTYSVLEVSASCARTHRHRPQNCDYCNRFHKIVGLHGGVELWGSMVEWGGCLCPDQDSLRSD